MEEMELQERILEVFKTVLHILPSVIVITVIKEPHQLYANHKLL